MSFSALTGAKQRVGNWPGVTVERKNGRFQLDGTEIELIDMPGTYALDVADHELSLDEKIARDFVHAREADLIVNILDASNLERNLYLTSQLVEMRTPLLVVLNMMDVAEPAEIGRTIAPAFSPMGLDEEKWPAAVGIFTGVLAKEAVVGTLDATYSALAAAEAGEGEETAPFSLTGGIAEALATIPANLGNALGTWSDPPGLGIFTFAVLVMRYNFFHRPECDGVPKISLLG